MKKKTKRRKATKPIIYTHTDLAGLRWRFVGSRPVSEFADRVMAQCGMKLP